MPHVYTAEGLIQQIRNSREEIRERLDELDVALNELDDTVGENEEGEDALEAQPALIDALRAAEYALRLAYAIAPVKAPSRHPALLPPSEPQREIEYALRQVELVLDKHLA